MRVHDFLMLRLIPDQARGESLNAGLAVFGADGVRIRLRVDSSRVRALHPALAAIDWNERAQDLEDQLRGLPSRSLQEFVLRTGSAPLFADARAGQLVAETELELEQRITDLLNRYVARPKAPPRAQEAPKSRLNRDLRQWLRRAKVFSPNVADIARQRVVPNYPIVAAAGLFAEFALQNGAIHVIETLDFRGVNHLTPGRVGSTSYKSVLLDQAKEVSPQGKRVAVIAADDYGAVRPAVNMIGKYADEVIAYEQTADRQRLATFLASALHLTSDLVPLS